MVFGRGPGAASRQAAALRREGVLVHARVGGLGGLTVDLATFGWFPSSLPSEVAADESSDSEQEG